MWMCQLIQDMVYFTGMWHGLLIGFDNTTFIFVEGVTVLPGRCICFHLDIENTFNGKPSV